MHVLDPAPVHKELDDESLPEGNKKHKFNAHELADGSERGQAWLECCIKSKKSRDGVQDGDIQHHGDDEGEGEEGEGVVVGA